MNDDIPAPSSEATRSVRDAPFTLGDCLVDPTRNMVFGEDGQESLEPLIMDVLCVLAQHPGEVLSRNRIIDAVWGTSFGADESLTRAISRLRKVLGDVRSPAKMIETIPRRGYRLIAKVVIDRSEGGSIEPVAPNGITLATQAHRRRWIVLAVIGLLAVSVMGVLIWSRGSATPVAPKPITVLLPPLDNVGTDLKGTARLLGDQIAASLSRSSLLGVRRTGAAAGAADAYTFVVHGTVQQGERGPRVSVDLGDAATGTNLWSATFDRSPAGGAPVGDDLSSKASADLITHILSAAKGVIRHKAPANLAPWELALLATWVPGSDEVFLKPHGADDLWPQLHALSLDPGYAPAHAVLASAMAYRAMFNPNLNENVVRRQARDHAEKARALAPYDADVLYEVATFYRLDGDREQAVAMLDRVLALQPGHPVARYDRIFVSALCTAGDAAAARQLNALLTELPVDSPVRWVVLSHIADLDLSSGDYDAALLAAGQSRQIVYMTWSGTTLAAAAAALGKDAEARRSSTETRREWPNLDWTRFAGVSLPLWCLHGLDQRHAAGAFNRLAKVAPMAASTRR